MCQVWAGSINAFEAKPSPGTLTRGDFFTLKGVEPLENRQRASGDMLYHSLGLRLVGFPCT